VKQLTANSLIALLCVGVLAPLVPSPQFETVPACCRRDGKHHCMKMASSRRDISERAAASISPAQTKCPLFPQALPWPMRVPVALRAVSAVFAEVVARPAVPPHTQNQCRVSLIRSHQKRGPPAVVFS
jgi:hypothetical protein